MNGRDILLAQIQALLQQLKSVKKSLSAEQIEENMRDAANFRFANVISQAETKLQGYQDYISDVPDDYDLSGYAHELAAQKKGCAELFNECLNFLGGALLRKLEPIDELCRIADTMLFQLSKKVGVEWNRLTILAEGNYYTETTGVIRLPFPDYSIWNLPVAVHELGHYVGPKISKPDGSYPFQDKVYQLRAAHADEEQAKQQQSFWGEEFSDVFAAYAIGPAYVCSALLLGFFPTDRVACKDGKSHPAHGKRMYLMLEMLRAMGNQYLGIVETLNELWASSLKAAGLNRCLDQAETIQLDNRLAELYAIVELATSVKYDNWPRATELAKGLKAQLTVAQLVEPGDTIPDILNGAWLWRITQTSVAEPQLQNVDRKAILMCQSIMNKN